MSISENIESIISRLKSFNEKRMSQVITENEIIQAKTFEKELSSKFEESAST